MHSQEKQNIRFQVTGSKEAFVSLRSWYEPHPFLFSVPMSLDQPASQSKRIPVKRRIKQLVAAAETRVRYGYTVPNKQK